MELVRQVQSPQISIIRAAPEGIIWLIVIAASIIAQVIKAGRKLQNKQPSPPSFEDGGKDPSAQLQQFLQSLGQNKQADPGPAPAAAPATLRRAVAPTPVKLAPSTRMHKAAQPGRRPAAPPPPLAAPPPRPPLPAKAVANDNVDVKPYAMRLPTHCHETRRETMVGDLRDPQLARKAIVLREILGPPIALRNAPTIDYR